MAAIEYIKIETVQFRKQSWVFKTIHTVENIKISPSKGFSQAVTNAETQSTDNVQLQEIITLPLYYVKVDLSAIQI